MARGDSHDVAVELVADTLAEAAGVVSWNEGLVGVAAQAPTEIATITAMIARPAKDGHRIYRTSGCTVLGRPQSGDTYW